MAFLLWRWLVSKGTPILEIAQLTVKSEPRLSISQSREDGDEVVASVGPGVPVP
jgi:hypothetical protein